MRAPLIALILACAAWTSGVSGTAQAAQPVLVELYTAQGCEACTRANGVVDELSQREGVLALTFPVDYWDYLGWADTFAQPQFTARQKAYMRPLGQRDVHTPQVIVDGRAPASGAKAEQIDLLVKEVARAGRRGPAMRFWGGGFVRVEAGRAPKGGGELWLVRYDPKPEPVEVGAGETRGQTLAYANVVRELVRLGSWNGRRKTFTLPPDKGGLKTAVVLQAERGGPVLSVIER